MRQFVRMGTGTGVSVLMLVLSLGLWVSGCGTGGMVGEAPAPELEEPQGDSGPAGARTLDSITTEQGYVEYVGDSDWFFLDIPSDVDTLRLELSNQALASAVDLSLTVYRSDENGTLGGILGGRYDPNGSDGLTEITLELTVDQVDAVYVVVRDLGADDTDALNSYFLKATFSSGPGDDNNSPETAVALDCGVAVQEAIQANNDLDWFRVQFPLGADILAISLTMPAGSPDLSLTLYDSAATTALMSISDTDGSNGATDLTWNARLSQPGSYYLAVRDVLNDDSDAGLSYTLQANCVTDPDANESNGNFPLLVQNLVTATDLIQDIPVSAWIASQGDEDWYRVFLPGNMLLNLSVQTTEGGSPLDLMATIYASNGQTVEAEFQIPMGADPTDFSTRIALPAGFHYLLIRDEDNDDADLDRAYSVSVHVDPDPDTNEPNGNYPTRPENLNHATLLALGATGSGYIGSNSDQDWFQVFVPQAGVYYFTLSNDQASAVDLSLSIYRPGGLSLILTRYEEDRQGEDGATFIEGQLFFFDAGTYYLLVQDYGNNETDLDVPYQLGLSSVPLPPGSQEPGELSADAVTIVSGEEVQGYIEFEEDRDWYGIEISGNQDVLVEMWTDAASPVEFIWFMYQPESSMVFASAGDSDEIDESPVSFITGDDEVFWVDEDHSGFYLFKLSDYNRNDWDLTVLYHFRVTLSPH